MSRKLTRQTVKPVVTYIRDINSGYYKFYHFTLDYYNGKPSFQGGGAYDLDGCYALGSGKPFDEYAINLETLDVLRLSDKTTVMNVRELL